MKKMLPNKVYNVLKWVAMIALPALGLFYSELASIWGLPYGSEIQDTANILGVLIGTLIAVSTANYNKLVNEDKGE